MAQIFPTDFEEKLTMAQDDYILFSDSEDGNKIKKAQYSNLKGEKGDTGAAATITVGSTTTGAAGSSASVTNSGTSSAAVLDFTIPKGDKGDKGDTGNTGTAATISVGTTTTGDAGTSASVTNSGTSSAAVFNFTIPKGDKGDTGSTGAAATITAGTTTTLSPGSSATVTNSGTSSAAVFNFGIPQGATGATGNGIASITSSKAGKITTVTITETNSTVDTFQISDGADGQGSGDVVGPASSTDGHLAVFDGITGKLIKDGGAVPTQVTVVDALDSTSTTSALSANQGRVLDGKIADLMAMGKFLSLWNCATGMPISFPLTTPYTYHTGDYFMVETLSSATPPVNYEPSGSSYSGTASTTVETDEVAKGDFYVYDGTVWLLATNHGKSVSFANLAGSPSDNTALANALAAKQDSLTTQTAYTTKGTATKVPTITTNTLGQVTAITETSITYPTQDVQVSTQANNILTSGMKIWAGTEADYGNLGTYDNQTIYFTI